MAEAVKVVAIVQARMGSTRLPGKVLADVAGKTLISRVLQRVDAARSVQECIVATTTERDDDVLAAYLTSQSIPVFRGSSDDVLDRYFKCAATRGVDIIVRVTADDPLKDPGIIEQAVEMLAQDSTLDYCSNTLEPTFPEGLDIEVFRREALERAWKEAVLPSEREHVTPYIWKHPELFNVANFRSDRDLADWRWTVDKPEDLKFVSAVFRHFYNSPLVPYREVVAWLDNNPDIRQINGDILRNEGYLKSLQNEQSNEQ